MAIEYQPRYNVVTTVESTAGTSATKTTNEYQSSVKEIVLLHTVTDDGAGNLHATYGTVNYAGKQVNVRLTEQDRTTTGYKSDYENASTFEGAGETGGGSSSSSKGGEYGETAVSEELLAASTVSVSYKVSGYSPTLRTFSFNAGPLLVDLCPYTTDYVVPGSVQFRLMGTTYIDDEGVLYRGRTSSDPGIASGRMNYATGIAELDDYVVAGPASDFLLESLWTQKMAWNTASVFGRTQSSPIAPSGFAMQITDVNGEQLTATAGLDGAITGDQVRGNINYQTGLFELQFGAFVLDSALTAAEKTEWWYDPADVGAVQTGRIWKPRVVDPRMLRYNAVSYFYLPIDAAILGIDPVRLPPDGRVPIFRRGGSAVVGHTYTGPDFEAANGMTVTTGRVRRSRMRVVGADGLTIHNGYTANLNAGSITFGDVTGYSQPVHVEDTSEDFVVIADVQIDGSLAFTRQLTHDYPAGSYVSSALMAGDLSARVSLVFAQGNFTSGWNDVVVPPTITAKYDHINYPITVTNEGAMPERWALVFTNTTTFSIIGEHLGVIGTGSINTVTAPVNPNSGTPYFSIPVAGWGSGWAAGNVVRLNTVGALFTPWLARTTQPGPEAGEDYDFEILARGGKDNPL